MAQKRIQLNNNSKEELQNVMNEVQVMQILNHPNIIKYYEYT